MLRAIESGSARRAVRDVAWPFILLSTAMRWPLVGWTIRLFDSILGLTICPLALLADTLC